MNKKDLKTIISHYGKDKQILKAIEEMTELQKELCKSVISDDNNNIDNITEEMADVEVMLNQLKIIFYNRRDVKKVIEEKIERTIERIFDESYKKIKQDYNKEKKRILKEKNIERK